ncbi:hypothetical protein HZS_5606 [Henneguya salminicola]|nr:hypothetical protein HZS_5606 [Henneguya salminicola]
MLGRITIDTDGCYKVAYNNGDDPNYDEASPKYILETSLIKPEILHSDKSNINSVKNSTFMEVDRKTRRAELASMKRIEEKLDKFEKTLKIVEQATLISAGCSGLFLFCYFVARIFIR